MVVRRPRAGRWRAPTNRSEIRDASHLRTRHSGSGPDCPALLLASSIRNTAGRVKTLENRVPVEARQGGGYGGGGGGGLLFASRERQLRVDSGRVFVAPRTTVPGAKRKSSREVGNHRFAPETGHSQEIRAAAWAKLIDQIAATELCRSPKIGRASCRERV